MNPKLKLLIGVFIVGFALITTAFAHHTASMYDQSHPQTISGTVKVFNWVNPHVTVEIIADARDNVPARLWILEASSPGVMTRSGWTKRSFQPGSRVTVEISPLRSGEPGGGFRKATLSDGKTLAWTFNAGPESK